MASPAILSHILVVDPSPPSPASPLLDALTDAGYRVSHARTMAELRRLTEQDSTFAAVITTVANDGELSGSLTELRHSNPHIPTIAIGEKQEEHARFALDYLEAGADASSIVGLVGDRLSVHHYDEAILEELAVATVDLMATFAPGNTIQWRDAFLRYDARMLGQMTSMIDIMGADLVGKIMLSGPDRWFERQSTGMLGVEDPNRAMISDAAAELCNVLAGRIRNHYLGRGLDSAMGTPTVFGGSDVFVRIFSPRPSLVLTFTCDLDEGDFYAEWLVERKAEDRAGQEPEIDAGELEFF